MSDGVVVVFRSRLDPAHVEEYAQWGERIDRLLPEIRGFRGIKTFVAEDGERVSIAEFDSIEDVLLWRAHPEHQEAQRLGKLRFYREYSLQTCQVLRTTRHRREDA